MEQLGTDYENVMHQQREVNPRSRFNWLYILPALGLLWLLYLVGAALFQWPVSNVVSPIMSLMIVFFVAMVGLLFWALAPKSNRE